MQRNYEPPGNESPWAKASGIPARRHTGLLPLVFTFLSQVGVGKTDRGCRRQAWEHAGSRLQSILSRHFAAVPTLGGHGVSLRFSESWKGAQSEGRELRGAAGCGMDSPASVTRSKNRFFFPPPLRSSSGTQTTGPWGWRRQHRGEGTQDWRPAN